MSYDLDVELAAIQFVLSVLIASHPNKRELLAAFDRVLSENQVAALSAGGKGIPAAFRASLDKYRSQIEESL